MQDSSSAAQKPKRKLCAEVCLELVLLETVRLMYDRENGPAPPATLEAIGFRVGMQLVERYTKDRPRLGDTLEVIKFICKDFWQAVFKKQVDNLKTNHRGIYVLQDNNFKWMQRLAPVAGSAAPSKDDPARKVAQSHLYLPCGIIRGALTHLGVSCTVDADPSRMPSCAFTVKIAS